MQEEGGGRIVGIEEKSLERKFGRGNGESTVCVKKLGEKGQLRKVKAEEVGFGEIIRNFKR